MFAFKCHKIMHNQGQPNAICANPYMRIIIVIDPVLYM